MNWRHNIANDFVSSVVVFLVALPLCLGIALASGAPLAGGLIAGAIGGMIVGSLSGSSVSVTGPAAGLTTIVLAGITQFGYPAFLFSVVLAGIIQLTLGFLRAGSLGHFFPDSVIKGMLAAIGLILILKQIPHAIGDDLDFIGDMAFLQADGRNTFTEIWQSLRQINKGIFFVSALSLIVLIAWARPSFQRFRFFRLIPSALMVVVMGIVINLIYRHFFPSMAIGATHLAAVPIIAEAGGLKSFFTFPDFSVITNSDIYTLAFTIAIVASLETLLSIEASDKLDPSKRITPLNRELKAQGVGNALSGLLGGLPVTSVIVRSTANVTAGGKTKFSTISHGVLLTVCVLIIPQILNMIPLASLAAVLLVLGYKLTKPSLYKEMYARGWSQFIPFIITVLAILVTDLLIGVLIGILVGVVFVMLTNFTESVVLVQHNNNYMIKFIRDASFLNKRSLKNKLSSIPDSSHIVIDGDAVKFIDADIIETLRDFVQSAPLREQDVEIKRSNLATHDFFKTVTS
ncbi:MAG: SulP family inorganic anion transporter [Cyclobacteriaceae bacterium]